MNEFYVEHLIKKKSTKRDYLIKGILIVLMIFSVKLVKIHPVFLLVPLLLLGLTVVAFFCLNVEYEYFYMNGIFEVDRIESKMRRRRVFEMRIDELEVMVPEGGFQVQPYRSVRKMDFSSRRANASRYEMIVGQYGRKRKIIIEPSELMVESMRKIEPKKVIV